jgi:sugar (pentulose or hexulose) kinase
MIWQDGSLTILPSYSHRLSRQSAILIFDIGKTTKKVLVFDRDFHVLDEQTEVFPEIRDDDDFPADDLVRVSAWVKDRYHQYLHHPAYEITHCNVSGYGASLVNIDAKGNVLPFYNYLKPFNGPGAERFASTYNQNKAVCVATASPYLGLLNSGLQLYWQKTEKPEYFKRIAHTLHLPQYFTWLLTGERFSEITSIGCHTMLWDYRTKAYHQWVTDEGLDILLPPLAATTHTIQKSEGPSSLKIGIGVHDSSAALMPYLATQHNPFLLLSTGTWNICFNPFNDSPLTDKELAADCLCYLTYEGQPVKASRIFLGHEHEVQVQRLSEHFHVDGDSFKRIRFNPAVYERLTAPDVPSRPFYPMGMENTGPLPEKAQSLTRLDNFADFEEAYHQLVRYLVEWQMMSVQLVDPSDEIKDVIIVGGFTKNFVFLETMKRRMKTRNVLISDHPRASALGAAWLVCGKEGYAGKEHLLSVTPYA